MTDCLHAASTKIVFRLVKGMYGCVKDIWISAHSPQRKSSNFTGKFEISRGDPLQNSTSSKRVNNLGADALLFLSANKQGKALGFAPSPQGQFSRAML